MQFTHKTRKTLEPYPLALQFYKYPPNYTISLEEFERLALERLQVLRIIERIAAKIGKARNEYRETVNNELRKQELYSYYKTSVDEERIDSKITEERRNDHISHFILRLAYCQSENLRRWFITQETDLFRVRFLNENAKYRREFMVQNDMDFKPIADEERDNLSNLLAASYYTSRTKVTTVNFYKVPFVEVIDLVKSRRVYLRKGYAYIPETDLVSLVVSAFRSHLSHALTITSRILPQLEEDGRLLGILKSIHQRYIGIDYTKQSCQYTGEATPEMIDQLSKESFPLCMRSLHETLRKTHHLKYFGRLQYGLFLKGIGLTMEDSMRFWREEFSKMMDLDKFDKQYAYGVRYNYGKEGRRKDFKPFSCMAIISKNGPGPGECHGCPFKHSDAETLRKKLQTLQIGQGPVSDIMDLVKNGHYQLGCTRYFEATNGQAPPDEAINHPNQYFQLSQKIKKGEITKSNKGTSHVPTSKTVVYESSKHQDAANSSVNDLEDDFEMDDDIEDLLKGI